MHFFNTLLSLLNEMSPYLLFGFFIAGLLHSFVPEQIYSKHLSESNWKSVVKAALLGVPLPLCSCGVLPTAVSLRNNGASRAASTSFLIATPQTGIDSIAATYSLLGPAYAIIRPVAALVTAMFGGTLVSMVEKGHAEDGESDSAPSCGDGCAVNSNLRYGSSLWGKLLEALHYGFFDMMKSIGKWLTIGLVVAAMITVLVPNDFFARYAQYPLLNMLVVLVIAVPMYVCATGSIPIALSLMLKGISPGTALVLLMAGPAANFASVLVINRSFGKKSTIAYLASIIGGAVAFGLMVDYLLPASWFVPKMSSLAIGCAHCESWFNVLCSIALVMMLVVAAVSMILDSVKNNKNKNDMTREYKIKGMMCPHCQANVQNNLSAIEGVEKVSVDLAKGIAYVEGDVAPEVIIAKINQLGYEYVPE